MQVRNSRQIMLALGLMAALGFAGCRKKVAAFASQLGAGADFGAADGFARGDADCGEGRRHGDVELDVDGRDRCGHRTGGGQSGAAGFDAGESCGFDDVHDHGYGAGRQRDCDRARDRRWRRDGGASSDFE